MGAPVEERVAYLEGRLGEQSQMINGIREAIVHLEQRMDARFAGVDGRFEGIDRRFEAIDRRFEAIDRRFEAIDRRFEALEHKMDDRFAAVDLRLAALDTKVSSHFTWLVGVQVTTLAAIVAAVLAR